MKKQNRQFRSTMLRSLLVVSMLSVGLAVARAQNTFNIDFNANIGILANDASDSSMMNARWNTQFSLLLDFNSVALRIENDATSTENITEVAFTIGDERFNFANFVQNNGLLLGADVVMSSAAMAATDPHIMGMNGISSFVTNVLTQTPVAAGADDADRLVVNFGNGGLAPGYYALFEVRFEFDDSIALADRPNSEPLLGISNSPIAQMFPSFQRILFDTDGASPSFYSDPVDLVDLSDNASVVVTYSSGEISDPTFLSDVIGLATTDRVDPRHPAPKFITPNVTGQAIPEPTAMALVLIGFAGMLTRRNR